MRLNKYIASAGVASRREADDLTRAGRVKVNGHVHRTLGYDVVDSDIVEVDGRTIQPSRRRVYIALHKPKGYITSTRDEQGRPTVLDLVTDIEERLFPVGRLDWETTGLLILTNDGDFSQRVTHPGHEVYKTYRARVEGVLSPERIVRLRRGVDLGGRVTAPAEVTLIRQSAGSALVDIRIREGRNRQVRRMFASVGNEVLELQRTAVGDVYLGGLKSGHYRKLKPREIDSLIGK
jgi:23S rRNA pseudouridine2605 synthase